MVWTFVFAANRALAFECGVSALRYDSLAKSLMLTLKKSLGTEYTPEVHKAWITVFSDFFHRIFPLVPVTKTVLIPASTDPRLSLVPANETNSKPNTTPSSH